MVARNYTNTAAPRTTTSSLSSASAGATDTVTLSSTAGLPSAPFTAALERNTVNEELVLVSGVAGSTATVTRGYDGTSSPAHSPGASFEHAVGAIDYREANSHINASAGVHGVSGSVVGTTDTQTLSSKTLQGAVALTVGVLPALTIRALASDPSIPVLQATDESGMTTTLLIGSSGIITGTAVSLQPVDDRIVALLKPKSGNTQDITRWSSAAGTALGKVDVSGQILFAGNASFGNLTPISGSRLSLQTGAAGTVGATLRGAASQSADLVAYQDSGANPLGSRGADGTAYGPAFGHTSKTGPKLAASTTGFQVVSTATGDVPLTLRQFAGQTGAMLQVKDSSGTVIGRLDAVAAAWLASKSHVGLDVANSAGTLSVATAGASEVPLTLYGADAGQAVPMLTVYDKATSGTEIAGMTADGRLYADAIKLGVTTNSGSTNATAPAATADTTNYPVGTSIRDATTGNGYPDTGVLVTHKYGRPRQVLIGQSRMYYRWASGTAWQPWRGGFGGSGEIAYSEVTSSELIAQSALRTLAPSASFTLLESRVVVAHVEAQVGGTSGDTVHLMLSTSTGTVLKTSGEITLASGSPNQPARITYRKLLAAGAYNWIVQTERVTGSGTFTVRASSTDPFFLQVLDLG